MPTSESCRPDRPRRPAPAAGFSLLELLVVLALIAMLGALVAPNLQRTYSAIAGSGERAEVRRQLERLPLQARSQGERIVIGADDTAAMAARLALPEGWVVRPLEPVRIESSGVCHPARVQLAGRGGSETVLLTSPACQVREAG